MYSFFVVNIARLKNFRSHPHRGNTHDLWAASSSAKERRRIRAKAITSDTCRRTLKIQAVVNLYRHFAALCSTMRRRTANSNRLTVPQSYLNSYIRLPIPFSNLCHFSHQQLPCIHQPSQNRIPVTWHISKLDSIIGQHLYG